MEGHLLQVLPSVMSELDGELAIEFDACESMRLYLDTFETVTLACPATQELGDSSLRRRRRVRDLPWGNRLRLLRLPEAYRLDQFLLHYLAVKRSLRAEIDAADYLIFSPHTLLGDWPTVAVREAVKLKRPYTIEADVVYDKVHEIDWIHGAKWKHAIKKAVMLPLFQYSHRYCLAHSSLALLQGQDVYDAYSPFCTNPHKVYHMPISKEDYITDVELHDKLEGITDKSQPLRICYVGRCIDMKGPADWVNTLSELIKSDVEIDATWLGDGSLLPNMQAMAQDLGIADHVNFGGYVSDRAEIFRALKQSDLFLFCHKAPESPRCLVEALASGTPLIGYGSSYPKDLIARHGGGRFATVGDWKGLAQIVKDLVSNREELRQLVQSASAAGRHYERDATMQHRIDLIKQYLRPPVRSDRRATTN